MRYRYFVDFRHGSLVVANFSYGIAVLGTPQFPPYVVIRLILHNLRATLALLGQPSLDKDLPTSS